MSGLGVLSLSDSLQQRHIFAFDLVEAVGVLSIDVRCRTLEDLAQLFVGCILYVAWFGYEFAELELDDGVHLLLGELLHGLFITACLTKSALSLTVSVDLGGPIARLT